MLSAKRVAAAAAGLSFVLSGPALSQSIPENTRSSSDAVGAQKVVLAAARDLHLLGSNPKFAELLKKARGVVIVPDLVRGALVVGASGGTGVLVAHHDGQWSDPAFLTVGSVSIGVQAGGETGPVFIFLMTDKALAHYTRNSALSFNGGAALTIAAWSPNPRFQQFPIGGSDVIVWSGENGGFAGLDISGSDIKAKTVYDKAYYHNKYTETQQIIGNQGDPNASPLLSELPS